MTKKKCFRSSDLIKETTIIVESHIHIVFLSRTLNDFYLIKLILNSLHRHGVHVCISAFTPMRTNHDHSWDAKICFIATPVMIKRIKTVSSGSCAEC